MRRAGLRGLTVLRPVLAARAINRRGFAEIVVDAKDDHAAAFYRRFGSVPFPTRPGRLFLLIETAAEAGRGR